MDLYSFNRLICSFLFILILELVLIKSDENNTNISANNDLDSVFNGVYTECFMHLSYMCLQKKTLLYLRELNNLSEVSVFGDYVKFVKVNSTIIEDYRKEQLEKSGDSEELAFMIDRAVDNFFDNHVLKFSALGRDIALPRNVEEFVGRKRKGGGGGGGGGHGGGHGGGDDGGKKKMMMMAMMCMKMKLMMMVPAMMGMMGMMSFKGMMFSMMSFMLSKMMLLMKLLEKRGGAGGFGGGGGGGGDGGWMAGGGGGGAWMPAGGQDYAGGGGGGGGYDANGQWQSRSIAETPEALIDNKPVISFVKPIVSYNGNIGTGVFKKPILVYKKSNINFELGKEHENIIDEHRDHNNVRAKRDLHHNDANKFYKNDKQYTKVTHDLSLFEDNSDISKDTSLVEEKKRRSKRSIIDTLQNSYIYWVNRILGLNNNRRTNYQRYKIVNGIKYIYHPYPTRIMKQKTPKEIPVDNIKISDDGFTPILTADDFNKGEIMEGGVESRMNKKKFNKMKDTVNDTVEDNPWE